VFYAGHISLLGHKYNGGDIQNVGGETSWKMTNRKTEKETGRQQQYESSGNRIRMGGGWNWLRIVSNGRL